MLLYHLSVSMYTMISQFSRLFSFFLSFFSYRFKQEKLGPKLTVWTLVSKRRNCIFELHTPSIIIHAKIPWLASNFLKHTFEISGKDSDSTYFESLCLPSNPSLGFLQLWHLAQCSVQQSSHYDECQMNAQCSGLWRKSGFSKNHTEKLYGMETTTVFN